MVLVALDRSFSLVFPEQRRGVVLFDLTIEFNCVVFCVLERCCFDGRRRGAGDAESTGFYLLIRSGIWKD